MASSVDDSSQTAVTEIRNNLVCQMCEEPAKPGEKRWYRCLNLHQICTDCKGKRKKCSCGEPMSKKFCKMTEDLLNVKGLKLQIPCKNRKNGCQETRECGLEDHEAECIYRLVTCPLNAMRIGNHIWCEDQVIFQDVFEHFETFHYSIESFDGKRVKEHFHGHDGTNYVSSPMKLECNGRTFILCGKTKDKIIYRWVYIIGSPNEVKHFTYTLKFFGSNTTITFEGKVSVLDESFDTLLKAGKCFAMPNNVFMAQFVDEDRKYEYSVQIRNLKEEIKDDNYESGISDNDEDTKE